MPALASIALLALVIVGLVRLGFASVPVWILLVPFVLLACLDFEGRFARLNSVTARLGAIAYHFVIVATVIAAHQPLGGARTDGGGAVTGRPVHAAVASGCGSGGCGSSASGRCSGSCGGTGTTASSPSKGG